MGKAIEIQSGCMTVGLTGGIASGKTTVSDYFHQLGVPVIDADVIARMVVEPDSNGLSKLVEAFGSHILQAGQKVLDRQRLRQIIFDSEENLSLINSILHPLIRQEILRQINQVSQPYCIVSIPLLCETKDYLWLDRILVVDIAEKEQLARLSLRDGIEKKLAMDMINSQCRRKKRLSIADDVINNEKDIQALHDKVKDLHKFYTGISNNKKTLCY